MGTDPPPAPAGPGSDSTADRSVDPVVRRRLRAAAQPDGFLPFDRYMEISLYDPGRGFYDRTATRLGREGDFYTASHVHGLFGATLARHFEQLRRSEPPHPRYPVVEVGPGDGTLAADIRQALKPPPEGQAGWEYVLVERSATLRGAIQARLGSDSSGGIPWRFRTSIGTEGPFHGIVLANELLDAFPFRRFQKTDAGWTELGVTVPEAGPVQAARRDPERAHPPVGLPAHAPVGTALEVSDGMESWIRELADHLAGGRAVLIDYGAEEDVLIARGSAGTVEAIRDHQPVDPLTRPGTADISAWVNFTRVRRTARAAGLREMYYGPLSEALVAWGIEEVREQLEEDLDTLGATKLRLAQKSFLLGFGTFKVLELSPPGVST